MMIVIRNLSKAYENGTVPIVNLNLKICSGDVIAIIGPSGTGKSTLLRCINMLTEPTGGQILVDGEDITRPGCDLCRIRTKVGMVFQDFNLFGHMTVIENIMKPQIDILHRRRQDAYDKAEYLLDSVGLSSKCFSYPNELSGGQQQRVAIARTLAMDPEVILFDEPTSALDPSMIMEVQSVIKMLKESGRTMVIVTHDMDFARRIATRVLFMHGGTIYEEGTPDHIFNHPERELTRKFVERLSVLRYRIASPDYDLDVMRDELEEYGEKLLIEAERLSDLMLAVEEICINSIALESEDPDILVLVEYSERSDELHLSIRYSGTRFDCRESTNELFLHILESGRTRLNYRDWDEDESYYNHEIGLSFLWHQDDAGDAGLPL